MTADSPLFLSLFSAVILHTSFSTFVTVSSLLNRNMSWQFHVFRSDQQFSVKNNPGFLHILIHHLIHIVFNYFLFFFFFYCKSARKQLAPHGLRHSCVSQTQISNDTQFVKKNLQMCTMSSRINITLIPFFQQSNVDFSTAV